MAENEAMQGRIGKFLGSLRDDVQMKQLALKRYQIEYIAHGLADRLVEIPRQSLEEAKSLANTVCVRYCHRAKVRDMVTRLVVYDTKEGIENA